MKSVASIYERVIYVKKIFDDILSVDGTVDLASRCDSDFAGISAAFTAVLYHLCDW